METGLISGGHVFVRLNGVVFNARIIGKQVNGIVMVGQFIFTVTLILVFYTYFLVSYRWCLVAASFKRSSRTGTSDSYERPTLTCGRSRVSATAYGY